MLPKKHMLGLRCKREINNRLYPNSHPCGHKDATYASSASKIGFDVRSFVWSLTRHLAQLNRAMLIGAAPAAAQPREPPSMSCSRSEVSRLIRRLNARLVCTSVMVSTFSIPYNLSNSRCSSIDVVSKLGMYW